ncbi:amidohydrolase family protein [Nonomuraea sp. NPDC050556]|uniref:amidohydrolase family protein n=1 Tax=Nonomuraea sp. NPDC050556 TaxID=3364369 RepID=UPI0037B7D510
MFTISARRLFDGHDVLEDQVVRIDQGKIVDLAPGRAADVDLGDATLLPGLIDCHVHLTFDASDDAVAHLQTASDEELVAGMRQAAAHTLAKGVTTVRDLGDRNYLSLRLGLGPTEGPEILGSGPPITTTKGHCWFLGGEADGEEGVRAAVRERARNGAHVIKMMLTGGELTPGTRSWERQYELSEVRAAADEAHALGLPIAGHAHGADGIAYALEAGFDTIEHCTFFTEDGLDIDTELMARLAASDVVISLTMGVVPTDAPMPPRVRALLPRLGELLRAHRDMGMKVVIGTDAGIGPPKPHGLLPLGAQMLVEMGGFEALDVLRSITARAAEVCRVGDRKGSIAPGFDADLVAVTGDPVSDIGALHHPVGVWRLGHRL